MQNDGTCPNCGEQVTEGHAHSDADKAADEKAPWHFKLMVVALVLYLGFRFVDMFF
ncbi:hypothetical protein [Ilumatobacter sp.]|uniref:hypothetical protein n=1 Tax=Ilumatobacter sp. TaxID=1967498 RepID=UPI00374FDF7C